MTNKNLESLAYHTLSQTLKPEPDKEGWLAYLQLRIFHPNMTYTSMDGYSCDGIADYTKDVSWIGKQIVKWSTWHKERVILHESDKEFWNLSTEEIVKTWNSVVGFTEEIVNTRLEGIRRIVQ